VCRWLCLDRRWRGLCCFDEPNVRFGSKADLATNAANEWRADLDLVHATRETTRPTRAPTYDTISESRTLFGRSRLRDSRALATGSVMSTLEMYLERAAQCRHEATNTTLANVRERALRSALAWEGMADQLRLTGVYQRANEAARSA
jgi:hypothetical protein